ncbi:MAG: DUF3786 domain-containing protein [Methanocella sp.]|jgi:hypothetical protein
MTKLDLDQQTLLKLKDLTGTDHYSFLGFTLHTQTGAIDDTLARGRTLNDYTIMILTTLLTHYAKSTPKPASGNLIKYKDLPGGCAYAEALNRTAIQPIAEVFGNNPQDLAVAAQQIGGKPQNFGDCSVQIEALKGIPLTYTVWGSEEYPASANILYDETASSYLHTEDLAVLAELATCRLIQAKLES